MMIILIVLIVLLLCGGGYGYRANYYGQQGFGIITAVLLVLLLFVLIGSPIHGRRF